MERGFRQAKRDLIAALQTGTYLHAVRGSIEVKNLLATAEVCVPELIEIIEQCTGRHHSSSPHHAAPQIEVHVLARRPWYIKFYFIEPDAWFISVHQ